MDLEPAIPRRQMSLFMTNVTPSAGSGEVVLSQFIVQIRSRDSQNPGRPRHHAVGLAKRLQNEPPLEVVDRFGERQLGRLGEGRLRRALPPAESEVLPLDPIPLGLEEKT